MEDTAERTGSVDTDVPLMQQIKALLTNKYYILTQGGSQHRRTGLPAPVGCPCGKAWLCAGKGWTPLFRGWHPRQVFRL